MESSSQTVSPLRQRMIEDMRMRKLMPRTREAHLRAVRKLAKFLNRSPDIATDEDLRPPESMTSGDFSAKPTPGSCDG